MQDAASNTVAQAQALASTAVASAASGVAATSAWEAIGIGPAVLFMALTGTALGLLRSPPGGGRGRLFTLALIYTAVSAALAVLLSELMSIPRLGAVIALLLAYYAGQTVDATGAALKKRINRTIGGDSESDSPIDDGLGFRHRGRHRDDDFGGTDKGDD